MLKQLLVVLLFFGWLAAGCSTQVFPSPNLPAPVQPSDTSHPTSPVLPSATPIPILSPEDATPSATLTPGWTITFTPQAQTAQAVLEQTEQAGFLQTATSIVRVLQSTVTPHPMQTLVSPDGNWKAEVIIYDCTQVVSDEGITHSYEILKISGLKSQKEWTVETELINCHGIGAGGLGSLFWAPNSRFFYYTTAREGSPDGGSLGWVRPVSRFDLTSGKILPIVAIQFSPDRLKMAGGDGADLVVWNLNGEEQVRFKGTTVISRESANAWVQSVSWSADGHSLAYLISLSSDPGITTSFLVLANLDQKQATLLLESSSPAFVEVHWIDSSRLSLLSWFFSERIYNLVTNKLIPAAESSATPGS